MNKPGRMSGIDAKHRWNTTYLLLHRAKGYEDLISIFINSMHLRMRDADEDDDENLSDRILNSLVQPME
uniref:Uncharacterized protein n=1 Tax=Oryza brachyantha TaxID=4533 RepID=J3LQJ8_ORYBR